MSREFEGQTGVAGLLSSAQFRGETNGEQWNHFRFGGEGSAQSLNGSGTLCLHKQGKSQGRDLERPQWRTQVVPTQTDVAEWGCVRRDAVASLDNEECNLLVQSAVGEINYPASGVRGCHLLPEANLCRAPTITAECSACSEEDRDRGIEGAASSAEPLLSDCTCGGTAAKGYPQAARWDTVDESPVRHLGYAGTRGASRRCSFRRRSRGVCAARSAHLCPASSPEKTERSHFSSLFTGAAQRCCRFWCADGTVAHLSCAVSSEDERGVERCQPTSHDGLRRGYFQVDYGVAEEEYHRPSFRQPPSQDRRFEVSPQLSSQRHIVLVRQPQVFSVVVPTTDAVSEAQLATPKHCRRGDNSIRIVVPYTRTTRQSAAEPERRYDDGEDHRDLAHAASLRFRRGESTGISSGPGLRGAEAASQAARRCRRGGARREVRTHRPGDPSGGWPGVAAPGTPDLPRR